MENSSAFFDTILEYYTRDYTRLINRKIIEAMIHEGKIILKPKYKIFKLYISRH